MALSIASLFTITMVFAQTSQSAFAGDPTTGPALVTHYNEDGTAICPFIDSDGNIVAQESTNGVLVITNSKNGNINFNCQTEGIFNDTGAEVVWNFDNTGGILIGFGTSTTNWEMTINEDGKGILSAHFKN